MPLQPLHPPVPQTPRTLLSLQYLRLQQPRSRSLQSTCNSASLTRTSPPRSLTATPRNTRAL
ncbi:hypothetical protein FKM82_028111 [Ascaphus truei]